MRTIILYGAAMKLTNDHKLVTGPKQPRYYVRVKTTNLDFRDALEQARPRPREIVLNTIEL